MFRRWSAISGRCTTTCSSPSNTAVEMSASIRFSRVGAREWYLNTPEELGVPIHGSADGERQASRAR